MVETHGIGPREPVILADDFTALIAWYCEVLGFEVIKLYDKDYHYCNLETKTGYKVGIGDAQEMGVVPENRSCNTVVLQFEVDDLQEFFTHLGHHDCTILFGPSYSEKDGFWYGAFEDLEGNSCWVVDKQCP